MGESSCRMVIGRVRFHLIYTQNREHFEIIMLLLYAFPQVPPGDGRTAS